MEKISYGHDEWPNLELAGKTVREALNQYRDIFNLPSGAAIMVNGVEVREDYRIQDGDELELVRETGSKGQVIMKLAA